MTTLVSCINKKASVQGGRYTGLIRSKQGPVTVSYEHGNKLPISIKGRKYMGQLGNYDLLKKALIHGFC
jgi:hypothetical protein